MRPEKNAYGDYYHQYISLVEEEDLFLAMERSMDRSLTFWRGLSEEQGRYRYATGKWSIKELLQHIIDTERIFSYRALAVARGEQTALPGYDENEYADNSMADSRSLNEMTAELATVRKATLSLFRSFDESVLDRIGKASGSNLSVRAAGFIIVGHEIHHMNVVKERYL